MAVNQKQVEQEAFMERYYERFGFRVRRITRELRKMNKITREEEHRLRFPRNPGDIAWVAKKLGELGEDLES